MTRGNEFGNISMEQAMAFAASPAGKQLISLLEHKGGTELRNAQAHAAAGNLDQAKAELSSFLTDPKIRELLQQFGI